VKSRRLKTILTLALAFPAINAWAQTRTSVDPEVEKPCIESALAAQFESQLDTLLMQTDTLLRAMAEDKDTATAPDTMYVLGRNLRLLERSRRIEYSPDDMCLVQIDRLNRDTRIVAMIFSALLRGNKEIGIAPIANQAAKEALPQLLADAQAVEKTVERIAAEYTR